MEYTTTDIVNSLVIFVLMIAAITGEAWFGKGLRIWLVYITGCIWFKLFEILKELQVLP